GSSRLHRGRRDRRRRRGDARRPRHRAIGPRGALALRQLLPPHPRHHLRRGRARVPPRRRHDGWQVPDPRVPGRRTGPRLAGGGRGAGRHGGVRPHRLLLLRRQGPDLRLRRHHPFRHEHPPAQRLALLGRRARGAAAVLRRLRHRVHPLRQHRCPDGRLVPQGDQNRRRPERPQDADRRHRGPSLRQARRGAAADRRRRDLSVAGEGHHRRRRVDRALRRREARLQPRRALLLLPGLVGRRAQPLLLRRQAQIRRAAPGLPRNPGKRLPRRDAGDHGEVRLAEPAGAAALGRRRHPAPRLPARGAAGLLQGRLRLVRRDGRAQCDLQRGLREFPRLPRHAVPVVPGGGEHLRQLRLLPARPGAARRRRAASL
ncbi:MAG: TRAP transporter solute receptor, unknown substrate 6, partial [uncultured Acetobacteraceae bacterium]